jgi:hypothetical protein
MNFINQALTGAVTGVGDTAVVVLAAKHKLRQRLIIRNVSNAYTDQIGGLDVDPTALVFVCLSDAREAGLWQDMVLYPGETYESNGIDMYQGKVTVVAQAEVGQVAAVLTQECQ